MQPVKFKCMLITRAKSSNVSALVFVLLISVITTGCKKETNHGTDCRIITATNPSRSEPFHIRYDREKKIMETVAGTFVKSFVYTGDTVTLLFQHTGAFVNRTFIFRNSAGMATRIRIEGNAGGTEWVNINYLYHGEELVSSSVTTSGSAVPSVTTYEWRDGNLVSMISDSATTHLEYYGEKTRQTGDFFSIKQINDGYEIYRPKNLIKSIGSTNFSYAFDAGGKISSLTAATGNDQSTLNFDYECN
jgi:hypothetical protein